MNYSAASGPVSSVDIMPVPDLVRDDGSGIQFNFWIPSGLDPGSTGMTVRSKLRGIKP